MDEQLAKCRPFVPLKQKTPTGPNNNARIITGGGSEDSKRSRSRAGDESPCGTADGGRKEETSDPLPQEQRSKGTGALKVIIAVFPPCGQAGRDQSLGVEAT